MSIRTENSNTSFIVRDIDPAGFTMTPVVADLGRQRVVVDLFRPLGSCRPPRQPEVTFAVPFCIRPDPDEDDFF